MELCEYEKVAINTEADILTARTAVRDVATVLGLGLSDVTRVVTAVSELARNIVRYAGQGEMRYCVVTRDSRQGIEIVFIDQGPGITDIDLAMTQGYSTSRSLGLGLPGAKRLMDQMNIESREGEGTIITVVKWI